MANALPTEPSHRLRNAIHITPHLDQSRSELVLMGSNGGSLRAMWLSNWCPSISLVNFPKNCQADFPGHCSGHFTFLRENLLWLPGGPTAIVNECSCQTVIKVHLRSESHFFRRDICHFHLSGIYTCLPIFSQYYTLIEKKKTLNFPFILWKAGHPVNRLN